MSGIFKFKQFEVDQRGCAMKINTDGVLLASLVELDFAPKNLLDIGTGTGVLALMLAQRFLQAEVYAVEIDADASATALKNFQQAPFKDRLTVENIAIEKYQPSQKFDLIISNPPFFVNDLKNAELKKGIARHAGTQFFNDLLHKVNDIISDFGFFWFVLPIKQAQSLIDAAAELGFFAHKKIFMHSDVDKKAFRVIVALSKIKAEVKKEHLYIYESEKVYTESYKNLLKPFFLDY